MLAGLSKWPECRMPPGFCAIAGAEAAIAANSAAAAESLRRSRFIGVCPLE
jgi:hypothetical protein